MFVKNLCCLFFTCLVKFASEIILDLEVSLQKDLKNKLYVLNRHSAVELIYFTLCDCCYCECPFKVVVLIGVKIYILFPYLKNICKICSSNISLCFLRAIYLLLASFYQSGQWFISVLVFSRSQLLASAIFFVIIVSCLTGFPSDLQFS